MATSFVIRLDFSECAKARLRQTRLRLSPLVMAAMDAFLLLALLLGVANAEYARLDLGQVQWTASSASQGIEVPAKAVPGGIFTDLQNAGILTGEFYYRFNDFDFRWVAHENWTYSCTFTLSAAAVASDVLVLDAQGIDTVSAISVNGQSVGATENMFRRYTFDIKGAAVAGANELVVAFESPLSYATRKFNEQAQEHIVPPVCVDPQFQGECHANHIRKMQASFSWDWGPAFPSMGIWRPIAVESYNVAVLRYVKWSTALVSGEWDITVEAIFDVDPGQAGDVSGTLTVTLGETPETFDVTLAPSETAGEATATVKLSRSSSAVDTWWPNGYGSQTLYDLNVAFADATGEDETDLSMKVAFRTVELVQEPLTQGLSFKFRVNGIDIFMKGSNFIPAHVLPEEVSPAYVRQLMLSAKEAHMNMMRVWGGGIYEQDAFYEAADEFGILIWQDFMFACSMYPATQDFLDNSRAETSYQIRRLQHHASIALWAGNNENEAALRGNWYGTDGNFQLYKDEYIRLYVDTIMDQALKEDPSRQFLISSPNNGDQSIEEGYVAANPYSSLYGDVHIYIYDKDNWDPSIYPKTRFASEYGFQSFPSFEVLSAVTEDFDWSYYSDLMHHRQRHPNGNLELPWQIHTKMLLPMDDLDTEEGFREFLYLAQIYQAESLRTETEHYRRQMSAMDPATGEGQTMGALYWQLNDVWPGASWTSMEHGGKWKMSHYFAERMFRPVLLSPVVSNGQLNVHLVSDQLTFLEDITLKVEVRKWDSFQTTYEVEQSVASFPPQTANVIYSVSWNQILTNGLCYAGGDPGNAENLRSGYCLITFTLESSTGVVLSDASWMPYPKGASGLVVPTLTIGTVTDVTATCAKAVSGEYNGCFDIDVSTDAIAIYVWIEAIGLSGRFDANGWLMTSASRRVRFFCRDADVTPQQLEDSLQIRSYRNSYVEAAKTSKGELRRPRSRKQQKQSASGKERLVNQLRGR